MGWGVLLLLTYVMGTRIAETAQMSVCVRISSLVTLDRRGSVYHEGNIEDQTCCTPTVTLADLIKPWIEK